MYTKGVWKWFGVKTLFRAVPTGNPLGRDPLYDPEVTLVEERVLIIRARSHNEALHKAKREAVRYCKAGPHRNPYGQRVAVRSLSPTDSFELFSAPASGSEVYSRTEVVPRSVSDSACATRMLGPKQEKASVHASRRNVLDIAFSKPAPGVSLTPAELRLRTPRGGSRTR